MRHKTKSTVSLLLFLGLAFVLALSASCGGVESGEGAEQPVPDGSTVKRLADFETGTARAKLPDTQRDASQKVTASSGDNEASSASAGRNNAAKSGKAKSGNGVADDGGARAGKASGGAKPGEKEAAGRSGNRSGKVKLRVGGDPGTEFSGTCNVGGEQRNVSGRVPERYVYDLDGGELNCEIRITGSGTLEMTFTAEGNRRVQKIKADGGTLNISYSGDGLSSASSSTSSVTGSSRQSVISSSN